MHRKVAEEVSREPYTTDFREEKFPYLTSQAAEQDQNLKNINQIESLSQLILVVCYNAVRLHIYQ